MTWIADWRQASEPEQSGRNVRSYFIRRTPRYIRIWRFLFVLKWIVEVFVSVTIFFFSNSFCLGCVGEESWKEVRQKPRAVFGQCNPMSTRDANRQSIFTRNSHSPYLHRWHTEYVFYHRPNWIASTQDANQRTVDVMIAAHQTLMRRTKTHHLLILLDVPQPRHRFNWYANDKSGCMAFAVRKVADAQQTYSTNSTQLPTSLWTMF